jgi:hypothetical protein
LWYYCTQPDGKDVFLYNRYDNNGDKPATPAFWFDDSHAYRLCSVVQKQGMGDMATYISWANLAGRFIRVVGNTAEWYNVPAVISDETTRDLFAFSIKMTNEPQIIIVHADDSSGRHTMICYRATKDALYIADPNYPGNTERKVELVNGKFAPYQSADNKDDIDAGRSIAFPHIMYFARSSVKDFGKIAQHWSELKNGTIGEGVFPPYELVAKVEGKEFPLEGYKSKEKKLSVGAKSEFDWFMVIFRGTKPVQLDGDRIELDTGENEFGVLITQKITVNNKPDAKYIDFRHITITYEPEETKTPVVTKPATTTPASAAGTGWVLDGQPVISKDKDADLPPCYTGRKVIVSNGTGSGTVTYSPDCFKQGSGTYTGNVNWTPPPSSLTTGNKITLTMTATKSGGDASQAAGLIKVDNRTIIEAYDTGQKTGTGVFEVPKGSPGSKLEIYVSFMTCGLHGYVTYNYIYK